MPHGVLRDWRFLKGGEAATSDGFQQIMDFSEAFVTVPGSSAYPRHLYVEANRVKASCARLLDCCSRRLRNHYGLVLRGKPPRDQPYG